MKHTVKIGGLEIGTGMPKVAVPVVAAEAAEAAAQGDQIMRTPSDLVELRADCIRNCQDERAVLEVLTALRSTVPDRPILFTLRSDREGGKSTLTEEQYLTVCRAAIGAPETDAIDLEHAWGSEAIQPLLDEAAARGVTTILSCHDFEKTPSSEYIVAHMMTMAEAGGDIVKMAVMPQSDADALEVLRASAELKRVLQKPFILISMSGLGLVSRLGAEQFGSAVTFAQAAVASAPGQIQADDLDRILRIIHHKFLGDGETMFGEKPKIPKGSIAITGFMGSGKTTVSGKLSRLIGMPVQEIDDLLVEEAGMSIPEIFDQYGEAYFRDLEQAVCEKAAAGAPAIISCGGGTVMRQANVDILKKAGTVVLLEGSPDTVFDRVYKSAGDRPMLAKYMSRGYVSWLMKQREDAYRAAADIVIHIDGKNSDEVAREIASLLE